VEKDYKHKTLSQSMKKQDIHDFNIAELDIRIIFEGDGTNNISLIPSFSPFVTAVNVTPIETEMQLKIAIDVSLLILYFSPYFNSIIPAKITIGIVNSIGEISKESAIESAANETFESPTPIIEYLFKTKVIPSNAELIEIKSPTMMAFTIKG